MRSDVLDMLRPNMPRVANVAFFIAEEMSVTPVIWPIVVLLQLVFCIKEFLVLAAFT